MIKQSFFKKILIVIIFISFISITPKIVSAYSGGVPPIVFGQRVERVEKPVKPFREQILEIGKRIKKSLESIFSIFFSSEE